MIWEFEVFREDMTFKSSSVHRVAWAVTVLVCTFVNSEGKSARDDLIG